MSEYIKKSHNTNLLLFHLVCPAKRRKKVFLPEVEEELKKPIEEKVEEVEKVGEKEKGEKEVEEKEGKGEEKARK